MSDDDRAIDARAWRQSLPWYVRESRSPRTGLTYMRPFWHPRHLINAIDRFRWWRMGRRERRLDRRHFSRDNVMR